MITGSAGTGKSTMLKHLFQKLNDMDKIVYMAASTGLAACNLDIGTTSTFHSFLGAGTCQGTVQEILQEYKERGDFSKGLENLTSTDVLIIDEISMIDPETFLKFDALAKAVRCNSKPFGNIQVIVSGDWAQLPPVQKGRIESFVFETRPWADADFQVFVLEFIFRQHVDGDFRSLLQNVRRGQLTDHDTRLLRSRVNALPTLSNVTPVELYARRDRVDSVNNARMDALPGEAKIFKVIGKYRGTCDTKRGNAIYRKMLNSLPIDPLLKLKVGCAVILTVNLSISAKLSNGSQGRCSHISMRSLKTHFDRAGIVTGFTEAGLPIVTFASGRVQTIQLYQWSHSTDSKHMHKARRNRKRSLGQDAPGQTADDDFNGVEIFQIPLLKAFAITIHKSQGMTLDSAKMSLGLDVFASGQAYVALSRVRTLEGVILTDFHPNAIRANWKVVQFYDSYAKSEIPTHLFCKYGSSTDEKCGPVSVDSSAQPVLRRIMTFVDSITEDQDQSNDDDEGEEVAHENAEPHDNHFIDFT